jgi:hypothetical protein
MTYDYVRELIIPKFQKNITAENMQIYGTFKKYDCVIDFWFLFDEAGRIDEKSLVIKINPIGRAKFEDECNYV